MGKRSNFTRFKKDQYDTPLAAVLPLIPHLPRARFEYLEPCAGAGALVSHLYELSEGVCVGASDIDPKRADISNADALTHTWNPKARYFITNPPWARAILHPMIQILSRIMPTWLLIDADWMHTKQSADYMKYCEKVVSIGRVKWIADSKMTGKDNCCWYLFGSLPRRTEFFGREARGSI